MTALMIVGLDGAVARELAQVRPVHNPVAPAWSPDGRAIAAESGPPPGTGLGGNVDIVLIDVASGAVRALTADLASDGGPAWSPDGERIAFSSSRDGDSEIYTIAIDGSGLTNLTNDRATDFAPAWLPDGRIAFLSSRDRNWELYVMRADGSEPLNLTNHPGADIVSPVGHAPPAVSPDGSHIAVLSERDGNLEIYVVATDGSTSTRLNNEPGVTPGIDSGPTWSPDGRHVLFHSTRDGSPGLYVAEVGGAAPIFIAAGGGGLWSPSP